MGKTLFIALLCIFFGLTNFAGAETEMESQSREGGAGVSAESSLQVKTSPISVRGDLTVETAKGVVGRSFVLDGTKSQDDGVARRFEWEQVEGPIATLSDSDILKPTFTPSVAGTYVFELVVTDSEGARSVSQRSEFIIGNDAPSAKDTLPPGDPDFDLLKASPTQGSSGGMDRDGAALKEAAPVSSDQPDILKEEGITARMFAQDVDGNGGLDRSSLGPTDGTRGVDTLAELRVSGITVRGWDPKKKEAILAHAASIKETNTANDFGMYVASLAIAHEEVEEIVVTENKAEIFYPTRIKLFGFIPVNVTARAEAGVDGKTKVRYPWYAFLATKASAEAYVSLVVQIQARHEMAKSIIQNIRA